MVEQGHSDSAAMVSSLRRGLGTELLCYVLNIDEELVDGFELSPHQAGAANFLTSWAKSSPNSVDEIGDYIQMSGVLSRYVESEKTSVINLLRKMSGGLIEAAEVSGDPLVDALAELAADIWPVYLARPLRDAPATFWMSTPIGLYDHPAAGRAVALFLEDAELMKLFPYPPDEPRLEGTSGFLTGIRYNSLIVSNGQSGSLSLASVVSALISGPAFRLLMAGRPLGLSGMVPFIASSLTELRALAQGKEVRVPTLVGLAGLTLTEGAPLELPDGRLRRATGTDRQLFLGGSASVQTVYETTYPSRIYSIREHKLADSEDPFSEFSKYTSRMQAAYRTFAHSLDLLRLSLFLASSREEPWLARETARYTAHLTSPGGSMSWDPSLAGVLSFEMPVESYSRVLEWLSRVTQKHEQSLDIGMRRLLTAATSRSDPIDGFVDAVICWESLFGVQTETTFRVTASVAKLLEPTSLQKREDLQKELKKLYERRSRLVHGGSEPTAEEVTTLRERAVEVAASCLRAFYTEREDLIPLSSDARGARILME